MPADGKRTPASPLGGERQVFGTPRDYAALFGIDPTHTLRLVGRRRRAGAEGLDETRWLDEHDAERRLVARYRTWTRRATRPPYRRQLGWERFSLAGELLDREVRYWSEAKTPRRH